MGKPNLERCSRCGVLITWAPVEKEGLLYCCEGCALGSPCLCGQLEAALSERREVSGR